MWPDRQVISITVAYCIFYNARKRIEELQWVCTIKFIIYKYIKNYDYLEDTIDKSL